jgi:hypothetical protein
MGEQSAPGRRSERISRKEGLNYRDTPPVAGGLRKDSKEAARVSQMGRDALRDRRLAGGDDDATGGPCVSLTDTAPASQEVGSLSNNTQKP